MPRSPKKRVRIWSPSPSRSPSIPRKKTKSKLKGKKGTPSTKGQQPRSKLKRREKPRPSANYAEMMRRFNEDFEELDDKPPRFSNVCTKTSSPVSSPHTSRDSLQSMFDLDESIHIDGTGFGWRDD
jgi:hypothetical protein